MGFIVLFIVAIAIWFLISTISDSNRIAKYQDFEDSMNDFEVSKRLYSDNREIGMLYDKTKNKARIIHYKAKKYEDIDCLELGETLVFGSAIVFYDKKSNNITISSIAGDNGKDEEMKISKIESFKADRFVWNRIGFCSIGIMNFCSRTCIAIDNSDKKVLIVKNVYNPSERRILSFCDIISVEIIENGTTMFSKSTTRTIGGALVGNVLMGGAGAVVGGLSGKAKKADKVDSISVKVLVRDVENPTIILNLYKGNGLDTTKEDYKKLNEFANEIKDTISVIIDSVDNESKTQEVKGGNQNVSISDELIKITKLKEDGFLTEEEFSKIKERLLNS